MIKRVEASASIFEYLRKNEIVNLNIIGIIENEPEAEIFSNSDGQPKGVVVRNGYMNYIYTEEDSFLDEAFETLFQVGFFGFSGVYRPIAEKIKKKYIVNWESRCDLYYHPGNNLDLGLIKNSVHKAELRDANIIDELYNYRSEWSLDAIKKDIIKRPSSVIYDNGEIASWVLVHNDNSIGLMYTKDKFRKRGYALDVTIDITANILESGKIPYLHINETNNMSPGLAKKCGFVKYGHADWFGIIVGMPRELVDFNNESREQHIGNIGATLEIENCNLDCMYMALYGLKDEYKRIDGFTLEKITNAEMRNKWCDTFIKNTDKTDKKFFKENILKAVSNSENEYSLYIGSFNGMPVSTVSFLSLDDEISGVYFISAIPSIENRDFLKETIVQASRKEKEKGVEILVIQSPKMYRDLLFDIGFIHTHYIEK